MRKYVTELIGTFFLVLTVVVVVLATPMGGALAIGAILMVMVYAGGRISGGHYNPAVTFAAWLRGILPTREIVPYLIAQGAGALLGTYAASSIMTGKVALLAAHPAVVPTMLAEALFTFALAFVMLNTATTRSTANNSYFGLAIGFTVTVGVIVAGPISGGVFNPAIALALATLGALPLNELTPFVIAQLVGAGVAAGVFLFLNPEEKH